MFSLERAITIKFIRVLPYKVYQQATWQRDEAWTEAPSNVVRGDDVAEVEHGGQYGNQGRSKIRIPDTQS